MIKSTKITRLQNKVSCLEEKLGFMNCKARRDENDEMISSMPPSEQDVQEKCYRIRSSRWRMSILLQKNTFAQHFCELQEMLDNRSKNFMKLQNVVAELKGHLVQDKEEIRSLRRQKSLHTDRVLQLENELEKYNFMNVRIVELEKIVSSLERYVKEHDIDGLKRKLQDRECKIGQLRNQIVQLKEMSRFQECQLAKGISELSGLSDNKLTQVEEKVEETKKMAHTSSEETEETNGTQKCMELCDDKWEKFLIVQLRGKEQKMKEMEHDISEKDNTIQTYEQLTAEQRNEIVELERTIAGLENKLHAIEDTDDNKKIEELEMKMDFLKNAHATRVNTIDNLIIILNEKEKKERELRRHIEHIETELQMVNLELVKENLGNEGSWLYELLLQQNSTEKGNNGHMQLLLKNHIVELEREIEELRADKATTCAKCQSVSHKDEKKNQGRFDIKFSPPLEQPQDNICRPSYKKSFRSLIVETYSAADRSSSLTDSQVPQAEEEAEKVKELKKMVTEKNAVLEAGSEDSEERIYKDAQQMINDSLKNTPDVE